MYKMFPPSSSSANFVWRKVAISAKYFAMSAIAAVLKFVEITHSISFALNSLRIRYEASEGDQKRST